jgi:CBS domain-containing protein
MGIVTTRDMAKARLHSLMHVPASAFMTENVKTIEPGAPLVTARKLIPSRDIGPIPVLDDTGLVGILSRQDLFRAEEENNDAGLVGEN